MWGEHIKALEKVAEKTGKTPPALRDMPQPTLLSVDYLNAFYTLSVSRESAVSPLRVQDVKAYFDGSQLFEDFEEFLYIMQVADRAHVNKA